MSNQQVLNQVVPNEIQFDVGGMRFATQEWGQAGQFPVIALHGWLDNCASFSRLAAQLKGVHLLALDMAGHGQTSHRAQFSPYNIWQDVGDVFSIADHMGWDKFALIGHSRGAIVSMLSAGTFPDRITHLGLIDGLWPDPVMAADAPDQLARSILELHALQRKSPAVYPDIETAIGARASGYFALSYQAAEALTRRGLKLVPGGYVWSTDPLLFVASSFKLTQDHIKAFVRRIRANTKLILAKEGVLEKFEQFQENLGLFPHIDVNTLSGGHHLHMESESPKVAELLNELLFGK